MPNPKDWFEHMREDITHAATNYESDNYSAVHYFLGRLVGDVRVLRDMMEQEKCEFAESSKP